MKKRFQVQPILVDGLLMHTTIDRKSNQLSIIQYRHEVDAILEADFLNAAKAILEALGAPSMLTTRRTTDQQTYEDAT